VKTEKNMQMMKFLFILLICISLVNCVQFNCFCFANGKQTERCAKKFRIHFRIQTNKEISKTYIIDILFILSSNIIYMFFFFIFSNQSEFIFYFILFFFFIFNLQNNVNIININNINLNLFIFSII